MFNNTFQAILLLVIFTIRRKISSTQNKHWKQLPKHQSVPSIAGHSGLLRTFSILPLQRSPQIWGCQCKQGFKHLEHWSLCPVSPCQVAQKGWCLLLRAGRALAPHSPLGSAPRTRSLEKPLQLILQRGGGHVLSSPSRVPHSSSKHRAHVQVLFLHFQVRKWRFSNAVFSPSSSRCSNKLRPTE